MFRRAPLLAALLAVALAAGGCTTSTSSSSGKFAGEQKAVAQTIDDLQTAGARRQQDRVCSDVLAKALVDRLERAAGGCLAAVKNALKNIDNSDLKVQTIRISGSTAVATVKTETGDRDQVDTLHLVKEGGRWRISSFG